MMIFFICLLSFVQGYLPLRTMGDTRLWYSFFLFLIGYILYIRWKYKWLLSFSSLISSIFLIINLLKPELHSLYLIPSLRSIWFIPHVVIYILAYSFMCTATISSFVQFVKIRKGKEDLTLYSDIDKMVYLGFSLLIIGFLIGMIWAREAWGNPWAWDIKETWALITCIA